MTDLEDYIKTTQLSIIWQREEATETCGYDFNGNISEAWTVQMFSITFLFYFLKSCSPLLIVLYFADKEPGVPSKF